MVYAQTSHNKRYTLRRLRRLGLRKNAVGLRPLCIFAPPHFLRLLGTLRVPLSQLQKRRIPRTLNAICHYV